MRLNTIGDVKEIPSEYKCENLFKMELRADSIFGGQKNLFQESSTRQYEVFEKWLDENAKGMTAEQLKAVKDKIREATGPMDQLNDREGYRGTSFESVATLEASKRALEKIKDEMRLGGMREGFQSMIEEYAHFNESARDALMERLTPIYIVVGRHGGKTIYKYRDEILRGERDFYSREKAEAGDILSGRSGGASGKKDLLESLEGYFASFYMGRGSTGGFAASESARDSKAKDLLGNLAGIVW